MNLRPLDPQLSSETFWGYFVSNPCCLNGMRILSKTILSTASIRSLCRLGRRMGQPPVPTLRTGFTLLKRSARSGVVSGQSSSNVIGIAFARSNSARSSGVNDKSCANVEPPSVLFAMIIPLSQLPQIRWTNASIQSLCYLGSVRIKPVFERNFSQP